MITAPFGSLRRSIQIVLDHHISQGRLVYSEKALEDSLVALAEKRDKDLLKPLLMKNLTKLVLTGSLWQAFKGEMPMGSGYVQDGRIGVYHYDHNRGITEKELVDDVRLNIEMIRHRSDSTRVFFIDDNNDLRDTVFESPQRARDWIANHKHKAKMILSDGSVEDFT